MITPGLLSPSPDYSSTNFVGREANKKKLEDAMTSDLVKLPQDTTDEGIAKCIKKNLNLNAVLEGSLLSSHSSKYGLLTRLQVIYYNMTNIDLPIDVE